MIEQSLHPKARFLLGFGPGKASKCSERSVTMAAPSARRRADPPTPTGLGFRGLGLGVRAGGAEAPEGTHSGRARSSRRGNSRSQRLLFSLS